MAKGKAVGSLRWDLVANADGLIQGLRKGQQAVDRHGRRMRRSAGMRGLGSMVMRTSTMMALGSAFASAAESARRLADANKDLYFQTLALSRGREMTFRNAAALQRAQRDPLMRGLGFAQQGAGLPGPAQGRAAIRTAESQRRLGEQLDRSRNAMADDASRWTNQMRDWGTAALGPVNRALEWMQGMAAAGRTMASRASVRQGFMLEAIRGQAQMNRLGGVRAADVGQIGAQTSARAGSAAEYAFFVRRQMREENQVLALATEQNLLLREIADKLGVERDAATGDVIGITGI